MRTGRHLQLVRTVGPVGQPKPRDGHAVVAGRHVGQLHATARGRALIYQLDRDRNASFLLAVESQKPASESTRPCPAAIRTDPAPVGRMAMASASCNEIGTRPAPRRPPPTSARKTMKLAPDAGGIAPPLCDEPRSAFGTTPTVAVPPDGGGLGRRQRAVQIRIQTVQYVFMVREIRCAASHEERQTENDRSNRIRSGRNEGSRGAGEITAPRLPS